MRIRNWPSPDYLLNRWPSSVSMFEERLSTPVSPKALRKAVVWAGIPNSHRALKAVGLRKSALRPLVKMVSLNRHANKYHDPQHTVSVIRAAGFIGVSSGLPAWHRAVLALAALIHDLEHQGRFCRKGYAAQETYSFQIAKRILSRYGVHPKIIRQVEELLLATYPASSEIEEIRSGPTGHMIECLVDADLFQSLFMKHSVVERLTGKLKHEMRFVQPTEELLHQFLAARRRVGLQSAGARWLHGALPEGYTYFNTRTGWF